ncbi:MAG: Flp pilus assembly protein CpaB [Pseudomonadota bacterium]
MNAPRLIGLGVALVAGAVAFFVAMGNRPEAPVEVIQKIEEKTVRVLVAQIDMQRGDRLTVDSFTWVDWPEKALSPQYLTEGSVSTEELENAVARTMIVEGEPVIEAKIVRAGSAGMMAAVLQPGMRAITARVNAETASGGFILPGDRVDVYYTEPDDRTGEIVFTLLLEDVKVLAVDALFTESTETPHVPGATATLELSPGAAEFFTTARSSRGQLSLALRSVFEPSEPVQDRVRNSVQVVRYGRS